MTEQSINKAKIEKDIESAKAQALEALKDADTTPLKPKEIQEIQTDTYQTHIKSVLQITQKSGVLPYSLLGIRFPSTNKNICHSPIFCIDLEHFTKHLTSTIKLPTIDEDTYEKLSKLVEALCRECPSEYKYEAGQFSTSLDTLIAFIKLYHGEKISNLIKKYSHFLVRDIFEANYIDTREIWKYSNESANLHLEKYRNTFYNTTKGYSVLCESQLASCLNFLEELKPTLELIYWEQVKAAHVLSIFSRASKGLIDENLSYLRLAFSPRDNMQSEYTTLN